MRGAGRAFVPSPVASLALSASEAPTSGSTSMPAPVQRAFVVILLFVFKYGTFHLNIQSATQEGSRADSRDDAGHRVRVRMMCPIVRDAVDF